MCLKIIRLILKYNFFLGASARPGGQPTPGGGSAAGGGGSGTPPSPGGGEQEPESGWAQILNSNPELKAIVNACER